MTGISHEFLVVSVASGIRILLSKLLQTVRKVPICSSRIKHSKWGRTSRLILAHTGHMVLRHFSLISEYSVLEFTQTKYIFYGSELTIWSLNLAIRQRIAKNVNSVLALEVLLPMSGF